MISRTWILLAALMWGGPAGAHAQSWSASRVDSHAPLGVMEDHTHEPGEWMLSFRAMRMVMDGNRTDTARVPADGVLVGYPVTPLRMPMDMYMVGAMYAPTDRLTLVGMVPVLGISMDHRTRTGVEFTTESGGIGDVKMSALVGVAAGARQRVHLHLGVSAPTGSIDERGETPAATNVRLPYLMQVGGGTWNVLPGLTYLGQTDAWSWGAQALGTVRLGENEYDYALGHRVSTTAWFSRRLSESASASLRLGVDRWGNISGADPELHPRMVPTADPARRAGSRADLGDWHQPLRRRRHTARCQGSASRWRSWCPCIRPSPARNLRRIGPWSSAGRRPSRPEHGALGGSARRPAQPWTRLVGGGYPGCFLGGCCLSTPRPRYCRVSVPKTSRFPQTSLLAVWRNRAVLPEKVSIARAGVMVPQVSPVPGVLTKVLGGNVTRPVSFTVPVIAGSSLVSSKIEIEPVSVSCAPACTTVMCMVPLRLIISTPATPEAVIVSGPR